VKLRLSKKERARLEVLEKIKSGHLSRRAGAKLLHLSYRQMLRVSARYAAEGAGAVGHRLRNQASNRKFTADRRDRILQLYESKYHDFGPRLACEYLARDDGETLSEETLRLWLTAAGLWRPRRQGARHRAWRERRAAWGEMVQMDGSEHGWFERRRAKASLMVMIDDATNWTHAKFFESETMVASMSLFQEYVGYYGLPRSLYVDRDSIYKTTRDSTVDEALCDRMPETQFGRAMRELDVELILANSPQAKGRVERRHGVFQDRLVKAMWLLNISTLEAGNHFLEEKFLDEMNKQFSVLARSPADLHRAVSHGTRLEHVLCYQEERHVQNDWTVSWCNRILQLSAQHQNLALARKRILVSELLDGTLRLTHRGRELTWKELPTRPQLSKPTPATLVPKPSAKPAANHPWRRRDP